MSRVDLALQHIIFCRDYSRRLIDSIPEADWYVMPPGCATHIGWQVGHITMAQFRLALLRTRGPQPGDEAIVPPEYITLFGKDSIPQVDSSLYPSPSEIRQVYDRVHQHVLREVPNFPDADWDLPPYGEHPLAKTRGECLMWTGRHEMLHAGQIGLLRRLFGMAPQW
ncbi:MAG: DinB family protein [Planctomycetales bacterium]